MGEGGWSRWWRNGWILWQIMKRDEDRLDRSCGEVGVRKIEILIMKK